MTATIDSNTGVQRAPKAMNATGQLTNNVSITAGTNR